MYLYKRLQLLVNIGNCRPQQSQKRILSHSILLFWIQNEGFLCSWAGHTAATATVALLLALSGSSRWRWPLLGGVNAHGAPHSSLLLFQKRTRRQQQLPLFGINLTLRKGSCPWFQSWSFNYFFKVLVVLMFSVSVEVPLFVCFSYFSYILCLSQTPLERETKSREHICFIVNIAFFWNLLDLFSTVDLTFF